MTLEYGASPDKIDEFFRRKRSWSSVKDKIVHDYIRCYLKTVHALQRPILIVDAFSGPGRFGDGSDGSPLIICKAIHEQAPRAEMTCLFADSRESHRAALLENLRPYIEGRTCAAPFESCEAALTSALSLGARATLFFYLDPYGIKDLEFDMVRQIYERDLKKSTEVLINFNFRTFMRMSGNWTFNDAASEVARKVKTGKVDTLNRVMGGDYWQKILSQTGIDKVNREIAVMDAYLQRVREYFPFAYAIPVKERTDDDTSIPDDELAHYHLIFGSRSRRAVVYMNDVALNALEPYLAQFKEGLLFDFTPRRYQPAEVAVVKNGIVDSVRASPLRRPEILERIIPTYFMHYRAKEYRAMIDELTFQEGRLFADPSGLKRRGKLNDDVLLSATPYGPAPPTPKAAELF